MSSILALASELFPPPLNDDVAADVLLWRNKKISASVLSAATAIWVLFEWLNYNFLTLLFFVLALGMLAQFLWTNASGLFGRLSKHLCFFSFDVWLSVNILCYFIALSKRALFSGVTGSHLKFPVSFSQKISSWILRLQLVLRLTVVWGFFKMFHVEEA